MRTLVAAFAWTCALVGQALPWGQEGHSVVAEIAQRRLSSGAASTVESLLGKGHSLASISNWADDVRGERPATSNWHFADIPVVSDTYVPARDCTPDPEKGDCIVAELDRLKSELRCASGQEKIEALKFAVHFVADIHQPMHTVLEEFGGNLIEVDLTMNGLTCTHNCEPVHTNFHRAWDSDLIHKTVFNWGTYVERLENGWLKSAEARQAGIDGGKPADWVVETHQFAQKVWQLLPNNKKLDEGYYKQALPIMDRQLGIAGLRLARFLNDAYSSSQCPVR